MAIGRVLMSVLVRGTVLFFLYIAVTPLLRDALLETYQKTIPPQVAALARACVGFVASLAVTIAMMVFLSAPASWAESPPLRGSISSESLCVGSAQVSDGPH